jgi:hypothetical protein
MRRKAYWLISNITGSAAHYRLGMPFIKHIYLKGMIEEDLDHPIIVNEIIICILNYLCNISH